MYNVSEAYKTESRQVIRNQSYVQLELKVIEPDAPDAAAVQSVSELPYSSAAEVVYQEGTDFEYATLEHNRFVLDGSQVLLPESEFSYQGFVSEQMSDSTGVFDNRPTISVSFDRTFTFVGLTLQFSEHMTSDYPSELNVRGLLGGVVVHEVAYNPDCMRYEIHDPIPTNEGDYIDALGIEFVGTNIPYRRVRLESLIFGLILSYDNDSLSAANWSREVSLISTELPVEKISASIIDVDKNFSPEKAQGLYAYLQERQPMSLKLGYELNDGTVEWMKAANMRTTSEFSVSANNTIPMVRVEAQSMLLALTEVWDKGVYSPEGRTLYDLADEMLSEATLIHPKYVLDESLKGFTTSYPLPRDAIRNNLQLIANAGLCVLYTDRSGQIHIEPMNTAKSDYALSFHDVYTAPTTKKYPVLYTVTTAYNRLDVAAESSELVKTDVNYSQLTQAEFTYSMSTEQSITLSEGLSMEGEAHFYAESCTCLLLGAGTVIVNGKEITVNSNIVRKQYNVNGEDCPLENTLITSREHAEAYADWIAAFEQRRNEYEVEDRGYPEIDMQDVISLETAFTPAADVQVIKHDISFNGAISGSSKFLICANEGDNDA